MGSLYNSVIMPHQAMHSCLRDVVRWHSMMLRRAQEEALIHSAPDGTVAAAIAHSASLVAPLPLPAARAANGAAAGAAGSPAKLPLGAQHRTLVRLC